MFLFETRVFGNLYDIQHMYNIHQLCVIQDSVCTATFCIPYSCLYKAHTHVYTCYTRFGITCNILYTLHNLACYTYNTHLYVVLFGLLCVLLLFYRVVCVLFVVCCVCVLLFYVFVCLRLFVCFCCMSFFVAVCCCLLLCCACVCLCLFVCV